MAGEVIAVASGKGGVGKTTTVVNLGVVLRRDDHSVALVDADLGMANLATMLGIEAELTLHDVLAGDASVEAALVEEAAGFAILAGSTDLMSYPDADPAELRAVLDTLAEGYDYVILDTGAGMSHEDVLPLGLADRVVLVTSPDPAAVDNTRKTAELASLARGTPAGVVVTKADEGTDPRSVADRVGVELLGVIPLDRAVRESTETARPLEALDPDGPAATAYRELAAVLVDGDAVDRASDVDEVGPATAVDDPPDEPAEAAPSGEAPSVESGGVSNDDESDDDTEGAVGSAEPTAPDSAGTEPTGSADEESTRTNDSTDPETAADAETPEASAEETDEGTTTDEPSADDEPDAEEDDLEEYLDEFDDDEKSSGGFLARLGRLFR